MTKRILILGGTSDALELANHLSANEHFSLIYSLAGRVEHPRVPNQNCEIRKGGFGGIDGLISYLTTHRIQAIIDATHPFAAQITRHAEQASQTTHIPLLIYARPRWSAVPQDRWHEVLNLQSAADLIPGLGRRVFLAIGRQEVSVFAHCTGVHFLIRSIEPPTGPLPPDASILLARGPFHLDDERTLLRDHAIDVIVTKNSGGPATYAKVEAARQLNIPVIMVQRPPAPSAPSVTTIPAVEEWLDKNKTPARRAITS
jgi:precorrin-6A/cobalt-precorrin-6A reductase